MNIFDINRDGKISLIENVLAYEMFVGSNKEVAADTKEPSQQINDNLKNACKCKVRQAEIEKNLIQMRESAIKIANALADINSVLNDLEDNIS